MCLLWQSRVWRLLTPSDMTLRLSWLTLVGLVACVEAEDPPATVIPIRNGDLDSTHLAVGEVFSDTTHCTGTLIGSRLVRTHGDCIGENMTFVLHDNGHFDQRNVVATLAGLLYLDRPIAHVVPVAFPRRPWESPAAGCRVVGFGREGVRRSTPVDIIWDDNGADEPDPRVTSIGHDLEDGDRGGPLLCDGVLAGTVYRPAQRDLHGSKNLMLRELTHERTDLVALDLSGTSPAGRILHAWNGNRVDVGTPLGLRASTPGAWRFVGAGDFDADHDDDLAFHDTATGEVRHLFMRSGSPTLSRPAGALSAATLSQGVGDFDGDHVADILWRHSSGQLSMWLGGTYQRSVLVGHDHRRRDVPMGWDWAVQGIGDFDADGRSDILWRHSSGGLSIWYMLANDRHGELYLPMADPTRIWNVEGVADIDQNGIADIVWRSTWGLVVIWFDGSPAKAGVSGVRDPIWRFAGVADVDDAGSNDLLWGNPSGHLSAWWMRDHVVLHEASISYDDDAARVFPVVGGLVQGRRWIDPAPVDKVVPSVQGQPEAQALEVLGSQGFVVLRATAPVSDCAEAGSVVRSTPSAGTVLPWGGYVMVVVGIAPPRCH
jgi:PASTA domain